MLVVPSPQSNIYDIVSSSRSVDTSERLYHADLGANYKTFFSNSIENDNASMINHLDHSDWNIPFSLSNWLYRYNTKPFFGYSQGCLAGRFHAGYAGCEQMICRHVDRHAFALVLNTGYGYGSGVNTNGASQYIHAFFWDYFFNEKADDMSSWQLGRAFGYAKDKMGAAFEGVSHAWCYAWYSAHFFGDPAQTLRIDDYNHPVTFNNENPDDGETGVSIFVSNLSVTINDPDGNLFNWSIETSPYVGNSSGFNSSNGTKTCNVSGLEYSTTYTWFVNASDGIVWTRESYVFTTEAAPVNDPPVFSGASITNGSTGVTLSTSSINITINDYEGDTFNWSIETSPYVGNSSGFDDSNGSKYCSISGLAAGITYRWYVNASDGENWTRNWYCFTANYAPSIVGPSPSNGSSGVSVGTSSLSVTITDYDGDLFNWSIVTYPNVGSNNVNNASNGSKTCSVSGLSYSTSYKWFVNVTDGNSWTNKTFVFTTVSYTPPHSGPPPSVNDPPVADAGGPYSGFVNQTISFDGSGSSDSDGTIASYSWVFGDGVSGTGKTVSHSYSTVGVFTVTLTVADNKGDTDSDTTSVTVNQVSNTNTSNHSGGDQPIVNGSSNQNKSNIPILIRVKIQSILGNVTIVNNVSVGNNVFYLIDANGDGFIDTLFNSASDKFSRVHKRDTDTYLIDEDGDEKWDYVYNAVYGSISPYVGEENDEKTFSFNPWVFVCVIFLVSVFVFILYYRNKRRLSVSSHNFYVDSGRRMSSRNFGYSFSKNEGARKKPPAGKNASGFTDELVNNLKLVESISKEDVDVLEEDVIKQKVDDLLKRVYKTGGYSLRKTDDGYSRDIDVSFLREHKLVTKFIDEIEFSDVKRKVMHDELKDSSVDSKVDAVLSIKHSFN